MSLPCGYSGKLYDLIWRFKMETSHDTFQADSYNSLQSSCIHEILWNDLRIGFPELKKSCLIKYSTNLWSPLKTPKCTWVTNWVQICQASSRREMLEVNREHIVSAFHKSMAREHTHGLRIDLNWRVDQSNFWRPWLLSNMRNMGICSVFCMPVFDHFQPISVQQLQMTKCWIRMQLTMVIYIYYNYFRLLNTTTAAWPQKNKPNPPGTRTASLQEIDQA